MHDANGAESRCHDLCDVMRRDDSTFLTPGSGPACEAVTEEVSLFVLAAHRPYGIAGRWRALVRDVFRGNGERSKEAAIPRVMSLESVSITSERLATLEVNTHVYISIFRNTLSVNSLDTTSNAMFL